MDIFEPEGERQTLAGAAMDARDVPSLPPDAAPVSSSQPAAVPAEETVFTILAGHARTRAPAHLWITAAVGGIDAVALMIARPALWWLSAGFAGAMFYAIWGLADRALDDRGPAGVRGPKRFMLRAVRGLAVVAGVAAIAAAALGFVGAVLGRRTPNW